MTGKQPNNVGRNKPAQAQRRAGVSGNPECAGNADSRLRSNRLIPAYLATRRVGGIVPATGRQLGLGQLRSLNGVWNVGCEAGEG